MVVKVFDNLTNTINCPWVPRADQLQGTPLEQLAEMAGRVCYDSFGTGRGSVEFHRHILEVGHLSIYEHCPVIIKSDWIKNVNNLYHNRGRLTLNLRHALELGIPIPNVAPMVIRDNSGEALMPECDEERCISFYLTGSRAFSHELVRHGDWTAISQRSTRYCDESDCQLICHPEIPIELWNSLIDDVREKYNILISALSFKDRKVARGAARMILPNALRTELIFSANLKQWKHIINMRCSPHADAEIREIIGVVAEML